MFYNVNFFVSRTAPATVVQHSETKSELHPFSKPPTPEPKPVELETPKKEEKKDDLITEEPIQPTNPPLGKDTVARALIEVCLYLLFQLLMLF